MLGEIDYVGLLPKCVEKLHICQVAKIEQGKSHGGSTDNIQGEINFISPDSLWLNKLHKGIFLIDIQDAKHHAMRLIFIFSFVHEVDKIVASFAFIDIESKLSQLCRGCDRRGQGQNLDGTPQTKRLVRKQELENVQNGAC